MLHLVKGRYREVQLHKDSPLGETVLECYATGVRNAFVLGFVPVKAENTVVLVARDTAANHPALKELGKRQGEEEQLRREGRRRPGPRAQGLLQQREGPQVRFV